MEEVQGWLSRERALALALVSATFVIGYLCYRLIVPFLPALAWAMALAVIAHPLHGRIMARTAHANLAAGISVLIVGLLIVAPTVFVAQSVVREAAKATVEAENMFSSGRWRSWMERHPRLDRLEGWIETQFGIPSTRNDAESDSLAGAERESVAIPLPGPASAERSATMLTTGLGSLISGTAWVLMQFFITFMTLFFFFRDRQHALGVLRSLMPLSSSEAEEVFRRVDDMIHATVYGSVVVALVQGGMGGLMFWGLGLPSPLLWGAVMALLAVVPILGTFVIWAPTAAYLALTGDWTRAMILAAWGGIAIGLIDNVLYPFLVGSRMRFHTLLVFFAIAGGLMLFGASGVVLGPVLLAVADALLQIWRRRTAFGGTID